MAAAGADIPSIVVVTGPMLSGTHRGERVCACTDCRKFWADYRAGRIDEAREYAARLLELVPSDPSVRQLVRELEEEGQ